MLSFVIWVKHVVLTGDKNYGKKEEKHIFNDKTIYELKLSYIHYHPPKAIKILLFQNLTD